MKQQVLPWAIIVTRKLELKQKVTDIEYKRAFTSHLFLDYLLKSEPKITDSIHRLYSLISFILIGRLSEEHLNSTLKIDNLNLVFEYNGLSQKPTRKELINFVAKHGGYYRKYLYEFVKTIKKQMGKNHNIYNE